MTDKLVLGTVQFGMNYGISNQRGQTPAKEVKGILAKAKEAGITTLDTSPLYKDSEKALGQAGVGDFQIITKTLRLEGGIKVETSLKASLQRLGVAKVYGLLIHSLDDVLGPEALRIIEEMEELKAQGLVEKIGISAYDPEDFAQISYLKRLNLVQIPYNVLDRRNQDLIKRLKDQGCEVHIRSIFLQGLLLMQPESIPDKAKKARHFVAKFQERAQEQGFSPLAAALNFGLNNPLIDKVVIGAEDSGQLVEIIEAVKASAFQAQGLEVEDINIIDPRFWQ